MARCPGSSWPYVLPSLLVVPGPLPQEGWGGAAIVSLPSSITKLHLLSSFPPFEQSPLGSKSPQWKAYVVRMSLPPNTITRAGEEGATGLCPEDAGGTWQRCPPQPTGLSSLLSIPAVGRGVYAETVCSYLTLGHSWRLSGSLVLYQGPFILPVRWIGVVLGPAVRSTGAL